MQSGLAELVLSPKLWQTPTENCWDVQELVNLLCANKALEIKNVYVFGSSRFRIWLRVG